MGIQELDIPKFHWLSALWGPQMSANLLFQAQLILDSPEVISWALAKLTDLLAQSHWKSLSLLENKY